ncbi:MAG: transglutaminase-like domain-containing protein, partial [Acidobacteriota bacterium]
LRQRENLDAAVTGAVSEFDTVLKLKDWVAAQFSIGNPDPYPPWDALIVLDWIRAGITGGFCGQYSQVLLQSLAALGIPARYIELGTTSNPYAHFAVEAWSNEFNKWVVIDADFNIHFEYAGVPQSALDVHDLLVTGRADELAVVQGSVRDGHPSPRDLPLGTAELYYYVRYHLNANHLSAPDEPAFDRFDDMVEWSDSRIGPWEDSPVPSDYPKERLTRQRTSDRAFVEAALNQVWATPRPAGPTQIAVDLQTNTPDQGWYEFRHVDTNGQAGPWTAHHSSTILWTVNATDRDLEIRSVNLRAMPGPTTVVGTTSQ